MDNFIEHILKDLEIIFCAFLAMRFNSLINMYLNKHMPLVKLAKRLWRWIKKRRKGNE